MRRAKAPTFRTAMPRTMFEVGTGFVADSWGRARTRKAIEFSI